MIGIDIIRKKRKAGSAGGRSSGLGVSTSSGGDAQNALHADEADHANRADEATHAASAKELDGTSSVWNTIRTWISGATDAMKDVFLRKDQDDTTLFKLTMGAVEVKGDATIGGDAKSTDYTHTGFPFGKGWAAMKDDGHGASMLEVDKLFVRMKAYFAELEIRKISYLGGNYVFSSAGGTIYYVEWLDTNKNVLEKTEDNKHLIDTFRCYLYSDDGTTKTMNWFQEDDQVRCQNFGDITDRTKAKEVDGVITKTDCTTHYWWRRVNAVDSGVIAAKGDGKKYEYVDFWNAPGQYGEGSDFPEEGDVMVQFGNWTNANRQGVIMIVVTGDDAPAIIEWQNVGANNQHFMIPDDAYSRISPRGEGNIFRGKFISEYGTTTDHTGTSIDEQIDALIDQLNDIKNQADKKFEIWFGSGTPHPGSSTDTESNAPASDWTTEAEKALHAQDLYYDTDKAPASEGGRTWRWMSHNVNSTAKYYWEEVTDKDTIDALEKAADLQNQVDDIVSDGVISRGSEKSELLIEWNKAVANYEKYKEQAKDYSLLNDDVWLKYNDAFFNVGTMLNNGTAYTEDSLKKDVTPAWLNVTVDTVLKDTPTKNAVSYRGTWTAYYTAFAAVLKLISAKAKELTYNAQKSADKANDVINDIISDGKLDPSEKITIKRDFLAFYHELTDDNGLEDKGQDEKGKFYTDGIEAAYNKVVDCFNEVGTILNGSSSSGWAMGAAMDESNLPVWLQNPPALSSSTDKNEYITMTSVVDADAFRSKWSLMHAAKSAYVTLLSEYAKGLADNAQDTADKKVQTFISRTVPETPYDSGDMWVNTADNNNLLISMQSRLTEQGTTYPEDWFDLSTIYDKNDPRMVLAAMAEKVYEISGGSLEGRGSIKVYLNLDYLPNGNEGDIALIGNSVSRHSLEWVELNNTSYVDTFKSVYNALGAVTITIYSAIPSTNAVEHDLVLRTINWHDPFKNDVVPGNMEILMYNGSSWEMLRESTKAIIENLGDEIRTVVFGPNGPGDEIDTSGLITQRMFNTLFSQKISFDSDNNVSNISKSGLVTTTDFGTWKNGELKGLLDNKLDVSAFAGMYAKAVETDGTIVKTSSMSVYVTKGNDGYISNAKIKADNINFYGTTIINDKFWVDTDGNVHMADAYVSGTITATAGNIAGFKISGDSLKGENAAKGSSVILSPGSISLTTGELEAYGNTKRTFTVDSDRNIVAAISSAAGNDSSYMTNVALQLSATYSSINTSYTPVALDIIAGITRGTAREVGYTSKSCSIAKSNDDSGIVGEMVNDVLHVRSGAMVLVDTAVQTSNRITLPEGPENGANYTFMGINNCTYSVYPPTGTKIHYNGENKDSLQAGANETVYVVAYNGKWYARKI
ncbi:MAG: hypothetical protein MSS51_07635 [Bacteroidales bacterium]|nr:hypothetical protein [Bacteroidales bacterium]